MVSCYNCGTEMIWGNDFDFEDCGYEGDGIVSCFTCPTCDTYAEFVVPFREYDLTDTH